MILIVSALVMVIVSYMTEKPSSQKISGLTLYTTTAEERNQSRSSWDIRDVISSLLVVVLIVAIYLYFTG